MLAFCAYYEGKVKGSEEEFDRYIREVHMPLVAKYPNLLQLRYLKGEEGAKFYLAFELFFKDWDAFAVAKVSEERTAAIADAEILNAMFDGVVTHVTYHNNEIAIP